MVRRIALQYAGKIKVAKFDVGEGFQEGERLANEQGIGIRGIPAVIIFHRGAIAVDFRKLGRPPSENEIAVALNGLLR